MSRRILDADELMKQIDANARSGDDGSKVMDYAALKQLITRDCPTVKIGLVVSADDNDVAEITLTSKTHEVRSFL